MLTSRLTGSAIGEMDVTFKEKSVIKRKMKDEIVARWPTAKLMECHILTLQTKKIDKKVSRAMAKLMIGRPTGCTKCDIEWYM